jgi:hypothetical protein
MNQAEPKQFVEVKVAGSVGEPVGSHAAIEVRLARGRSLMVVPGFDADHLRALLAVLESGA